jgi:uncharacterized protein YecE (DUF72 family)
VRIAIGTSGWSYPAWRGRFYAPEVTPRTMLPAYAARLPTVEVNATAYRMPRATMLAAWRAAVPPGFTFSVKAPQRITHRLRLAPAAAEPLGWFYRVAAELGATLGPVLFQVPPSMRKDLPRLRDFLALLPRSGRAVFSLPNASWRDGEVMRALADAGAALCVTDTDEETMPLLATAGFGYLRLRRSSYDDEALLAWAERIRTQPWREAFVYFKHEDEARGPAFALRMRALAGQAGLDDVVAGAVTG